MQRPSAQGKAVRYVGCGIVLWFIVDFGTAGGFRLSYLTTHGPLLLAFYIGYPLVFGYLIFKLHWEGWRLFLATVVAILIIEGVLTGNPFVLSFPLMLVGIPLAICVYTLLTYFPLWIVNGEMKRHKRIAALLSGVVVAVMALTTLSAR